MGGRNKLSWLKIAVAQAFQLTAITSVDDSFGVQVNSEDFGCWHVLARRGGGSHCAVHEAQRRLTLTSPLTASPRLAAS
jgi:hypothetical protein